MASVSNQARHKSVLNKRSIVSFVSSHNHKRSTSIEARENAPAESELDLAELQLLNCVVD
jgi:hypothetical protein